MADEFDATSRASFRTFDAEKLRFSDTDMIGHVNNVAFAALLESGRTAYGKEFLFPHMPRGMQVVMARVEIDYRRELHWPATVDVGTRLISVGRSSYVMAQGIFLDDACVATGRTTLVMIDRQTRRSSPLPEAYRAVLEQLTKY